MNRLSYFLIAFILISSSLVFSQTGEQNKHKQPSPTLHHEVKDDDYIPVSRAELGRSPGYHYTMAGITTTQVNVDVNGQNIVGDAANEPSIAIDPNNRNNIAIGWRQFNTVSSNFRQAGYGYTTDGGQTWTFPGVIESGVFRSDPVLDYDKEGNFYYNSLTNLPDYYCKVFKSSTGGSTWNSGTDAHGGDKQWMTIDKTDGTGSGHIYAFWTSVFSTCYPGFFTRSTDGGAYFENCVSIPDDPQWGTLAVAPNGNLYIGGTGTYDFVVVRSSNAQTPGQTVTFDMATSVSLDGYITYGIGPNPGGLGGQTSIGIDTSGGPYNGNIYLLCSVERISNPDPSDVMFARSTNGGTTWSSPVRINDDPGTSAYQWFGTMSVAPTGRIDVVWLDTRNYPGIYISALYYSYSTDGGETWSQNQRMSPFFDPHLGWPDQDKMGDYFDMVSDSTGASLAWAATFNTEEDVYYSHITAEVVPVELVSFSSSVAGNIVNLNWSTATETNNRGFEIQRSQDRSNWNRIGFIEGKGTTSEPQQYSYSDNLSDLSSTQLYYRLKQLDFDGTSSYSKVLEVKIAPSAFSLSQNYPNPFNPSTTIDYQLPENSFVTLKLYDVLGNEVITLINEEKPAGTHKFNWNASNLSSGVYYYQLRATPDGAQSGIFTGTKKLVLMK